MTDDPKRKESSIIEDLEQFFRWFAGEKDEVPKKSELKNISVYQKRISELRRDLRHAIKEKHLNFPKENSNPKEQKK